MPTETICYLCVVIRKDMKYEVEITRVSYSTLTFGVEAESEIKARRIALEQAADTGWSEDYADYKVVNSYETELTDEEWEEEFGGKGDGAF